MKPVNISGFAVKEPSNSKVQPIQLDDPALVPVVDQLIKEGDELKALEGSVKLLKETVTDAAYPIWVNFNHGAAVGYNGNVAIKGTNGEVRVNFNNGYRAAIKDDQQAEIGKLLSKDEVNKLFVQQYTFVIDSAEIPEKLLQGVIDDLLAIKAKHGLSDKSITVKAGLKPVGDFQEKRLSLLSKQKNLKLNTVLPTPSSVKVA